MQDTINGMPQIGAALGDWGTSFTLLKHTESIVNGFVQINQVPLCFQGTMQPLSARAISLKPEGQRSWIWLQMHCFTLPIDLIPSDHVTWENNIYKIMEHKDYSLNGYIEFHLVRDFQTGGSA